MTRTAPILAILLLLLPAGGPVAAKEEKPPRPPDEFLRAWVRGAAELELFEDLHAKYPRSPHKRDSEEFEVAIAAFRLRAACGADRETTLAAALVALYRAEATDEETRARILRVLGRIRAERGVGLVCEVARSSSGRLREAAVRSLGFFGNAPAGESFLVFGGRLRKVVYPPAHSVEATKTLLALLDEGKLARQVLEALESHRGAEVASAALEALRGKHANRPRRPLGEILVRNLPHVDLARLGALLGDERPAVRRTAAYVLGWSASARAVAPLLGLLADEDDGVRREADAALARLRGTAPPVREEIEARTREQWEEILGPDGAKLDPEKALRHEDPKPGIYRIGS